MEPEGDATAGRKEQNRQNASSRPHGAGRGRGNLFRRGPHILPVGCGLWRGTEDLPEHEEADQKERQEACTAQRRTVERKRIDALAEAVEEGRRGGSSHTSSFARTMPSERGRHATRPDPEEPGRAE